MFLLKFTNRTRTNLVSLASRAALAYRNQPAGHARTHQVPTAEFYEIADETNFVHENGTDRNSDQLQELAAGF